MKKIREIEIEAFIQATEDQEKAIFAIKNLFPPEIREEIEFEIEKLRGVYHNPISVIRATCTENAQQVLEHIAQKLDVSDKAYLYKSISRRVDEKGNMFLRFGKQELFREKMGIKEERDTIRIKIMFPKKPKKYSVQDITTILEEMDLIKA